MRYYSPEYLIQNANSKRRRAGMFMVGSTQYLGRVATDGYIELVDSEPDEVILRMHPDKPDEVYIRAGVNKPPAFFRHTFRLSISQPTKVAVFGTKYSVVPYNYYSYGTRKGTDYGGSSAETDGWVKLELKTFAHGKKWEIESADPLDTAKINEVARKAYIKEVQRVRKILRIRAKLDIIDKDKMPSKRWGKQPSPRAMLEKVQGDDLKAIHKFLGYIVSPYYRDDNAKVLKAYDQWVGLHRRILYKEFGCFAPS